MKNHEWSSHTGLMPGVYHLILLCMKSYVDGTFFLQKLVLILAQCFGVMPLMGITAKSPKQLKFTWFNFRMLHSAIVMFAQLTHAFYSLRWAVHNKVNVSVLGMYNFIFLFANFLHSKKIHFLFSSSFLVQSHLSGSHRNLHYRHILYGWQ